MYKHSKYLQLNTSFLNEIKKTYRARKVSFYTMFYEFLYKNTLLMAF